MRYTALFVFASLALAQPPQPPPKKQQRDLKLEKVETETTAPKAISIPRSYAVVVGISHYRNLPKEYQLEFPERDAQSIYTILISPEGGNFKQENVHVLTGEKATLAGLRREIDTWLPSVARDDDRVLIYFAGHGFMYEGKGYLAPYDIDLKNIGITGYSMDGLGAVIGSKIKAKWKILLTDACHSGAITPEETESINRTLTGLNKSLFSLTASRARERSFETPELEGGHGVFTYYVKQGMEGAADTSGDGIVTADELSEYVHTQVREATKGAQNPTSDRGNFDSDMLLAYVPANAKPATAPAPKFGTLIFESNMDGVEVFVDGKSEGVVSKGKPFSVAGLPPGQHTVQGVKMGYEPDGPRQETVYPGQDSTVTIRIMIVRRRNKAAEELFNKGMKLYNIGFEQNYRKAADFFSQALQTDPTYSKAAFYLGSTYNALFEEEKGQQYFKKAIEIDPDYLEARSNYAGALLDVGATDEAIRQLDVVLSREPKNVLALTMLAQADRMKLLYAQSIEAAQKAIQLNPNNAEPHLWLGDSLRLSGKYAEAKTAYEQYLKLSDFDSKAAGKLNYYVLGSLFGMGKKTHASQHDIWADLRSLAYFGLCDSQRKLSDLDSAIMNCQKSLTYGPKDPYAHYALGLAFMYKANKTGSIAELQPALQHLQKTIEINPDFAEAQLARQNIANIRKALNQ